MYFFKGSGRSIDEIHLKGTLDKIQDDIVGYGGHAGAAGLSIKKEMLSKFRKDFTKAVGDIPNIPEDIYYDLELNPFSISSSILAHCGTCTLKIWKSGVTFLYHERTNPGSDVK